MANSHWLTMSAVITPLYLLSCKIDKWLIFEYPNQN